MPRVFRSMACFVLCMSLFSTSSGFAAEAAQVLQDQHETSVLGLSLGGLVSSKDHAAQALIPEGTGLLGKSVSPDLLQGQGSQPPVMNLPGIGMPVTSMGGLEDGQLPLGGISSFGSMDGFPPFYAGPEASPTAQNPLIGSWGASNLQLSFDPSGTCVLEANGRKINGRWQSRGQELLLMFSNGQKCRLIYSIQGRMLVLSDGSRLMRKGDMPQSTASFPTSPAQAGSLEGFWAANDGRQMLVMAFMNGICALNFNGQQVYGPYVVRGNQLHVQFSNGKVMDITFTIEGNTLRFSDGTVLQRQPMPQPAPQPMPQPAPQPMPQPMPQPAPQSSNGPNVPWGPASPESARPSQAVSALEGAWSAQLPNGVQMVFVFKGNQYMVLANGQQSEAGIFRLDGQRLEYQTTAGQTAGQKGVNTWQIQGNILILTFPNGSALQLTRAS